MTNRRPSLIRAQMGLDLLIYRRSLASTMIIGVIVPLLLAMATHELAVAIPMVIGVGSVFAITAFGQDEVSNLNRLYESLPITRRQFITARYALLSCWLAVSCLFLLLLTALTRPSSPQMWAIPVLSTAILTLVNATLVPLIVRFGARRSTWVLFGLAGITGALVFSVGKFVIGQDDLANLFTSTWQMIWLPTALLAVTAMIALGVSWHIAQRLHAAKDF